MYVEWKIWLKWPNTFGCFAIVTSILWRQKKCVHKFCIVIIYIYMYMCIHSYANLLISQGFTQNVTAICYSCIIILVNCFIKDKNFRRDVFIDITKSLVNNNLYNFWQFKVFLRTSSSGAIIRGRGLLKRKIIMIKKEEKVDFPKWLSSF